MSNQISYTTSGFWHGKMYHDSNKFCIITRLGGTHLPSFLGVIFTKGERNLKCAHMRLKKPAALPSPSPPEPGAKSKAKASRHNGHNCRNSGIVQSKPRWVKRVGVSRIHKGSQIKSPIPRSSSLPESLFSPSSSSTNPHTWLGLNGTHVSDDMPYLFDHFGRNVR